MKKQNQLDSATLRQKAEELLSNSSEKSIAQLSEAEIYKLLHELQVHQIEMQLQNQELTQAREQTVIASDKYIELYDFAPTGYFTLSPLGNIIGLNLTGAKMLGIDRSQLKNRLFQLLVSESSKQIFQPFLKKVFSTNTTQSCELTLQKNSGNATYVFINGAVNEKGDQCFVTATDITERRQAELALLKSEKEFRQLAEAMPQIVWITRPDGWNIFFNQQWVGYTGLTMEESLGEGWNKPFHPDDQQRAWEAWQNATTNLATYSLECRIRRFDGEYKWWLVRGVPVFDEHGAVTKWFGTCTDIDEMKCAQTELIAAKEHAEESDRLKSAFLANMSHEIRTPMNGILGFTELLLEPDLSSEQKAAYINIVNQSGQRMLNTVNDIVEISKIESGLVNISNKKIDLNETVIELVRFFQPEAEKKGLELSIEMLLPEAKKHLLTDQNKLSSIMTNLIKNAIKYTDTGTIKVGCTILETHCHASLQLYVKDTGIGIPKDRQEAVFNRFEQADIADTRAFQGSGLGLAISKSYVEMLGGSIWVESVEGSGSTFYFTLPAKSDSAETQIADKKISSQNEKTKPKVKGLKILIAEDDETSRQFLSILIKDIGNEILEVQTGNEAIELCRQHKDIDLILMDIQMPGLDGYEATRRIREFNNDVIIIAQTAHGLSGDSEKALEAGCNDYIAKPIKREALLEKIQHYFNNKM